MQVRPLSEELQEKARVELGETPQHLQDGIQHLKDWIAKQPHLRARTDDQWLAAFLRGSKFSLERAKAKIDLFYTMRTTAPELFALNHRSPKFREILKQGILLVLPKLPKPTDPRILIMRLGQYDTKKFTFLEVVSVVNTISKVLFVDDDAQMVSGGASIVDMKGASMAHYTQVTPTVMKKLTLLGQDANPVRSKGTHFLNTPIGFQTVFNIAKGFLNEKNKQRIHVHNKDYKSLYKHIPKEILPKEYGGKGGSVKEIAGQLVKKIELYSDWLDEDMDFGTSESRRPGAPCSAEVMFGVEGSFRQLQFD